MKHLLPAILLLFSQTLSFGQKTNIKLMVDSIRFINTGTLNCSTVIYWRIIAQGEKAIPYLIDKLNDTLKTRVYFHCKAAKLNVGEVSYFALQQIGDFPAFAITRIQFDYFNDNNCWSFYDYFFNNSNKAQYQQLIKTWFHKNKAKFKRTNIPMKNQTECQKQYHITTFYQWAG